MQKTMANYSVDYTKLWNDFCFQVERLRGCDERTFQYVAENMFEKFGWEQFNKEIVSQQVIIIGSAQSLKPDIIIQSGNKRHFVVELKKTNADLSDRNKRQLISYMRQLKLRFGVLLGNSLQVYYEIENDYCDPILIADIVFSKDNKLGIEFMPIITKDGYTQKRFQDYCERKLEQQKESKNIETEIKNLCTEFGVDYIKGLLKADLQKRFLQTAVDEIINNIHITIQSKQSVIGQPKDIKPIRYRVANGDLRMQYENYLKNKGYNINTISSYCSGINKVIRLEKLSVWEQVAESISQFVREYETTKIQNDHNSTISALRRMQEFLKSGG